MCTYVCVTCSVHSKCSHLPLLHLHIGVTVVAPTYVSFVHRTSLTVAVAGSLFYARRHIQRRREEQRASGLRPVEKINWEERVALIEAAQQSSNTGQQSQEQMADSK